MVTTVWAINIRVKNQNNERSKVFFICIIQFPMDMSADAGERAIQNQDDQASR